MVDMRILPEGDMKEKALPPGGSHFQEKKPTIRSILAKAAISFFCAAILNVLLFLIVRAFGVHFVMRPDPTAELQAIGILNVVVSSFMGILGAVVVFFIISRFPKRASPIFIAISILIFLLSLSGPFTLASETSLFGKLTLSFMHIVVAGITVPALLKTLKS